MNTGYTKGTEPEMGSIFLLVVSLVYWGSPFLGKLAALDCHFTAGSYHFYCLPTCAGNMRAASVEQHQ